MTGKTSLTTYFAAALLAGAAGIGAVYVSSGGDSNAEPSETATTRNPSDDPSQTRGSFGSDDKPLPQAELKQTAALDGTAGSLKSLLKGDMIKFVVRQAPADLADLEFKTGTGEDRRLSEWRGKHVLLNVWATWCAPCLKEMPSLDNLKQALGGEQFDVVAISIDRGGPEKPRKFFEKTGLKNLELFQDASVKISSVLKVFGMPTTLLINANGQEIGRMVGPAEWDSEEAKQLINAVIGTPAKG
ncbi:MAG: TlpA disulfide reductase family protein [Hyphomicrobiaceae bacterium]